MGEWYYYRGRKVIPVPVGGGQVVAVRPGTKFEVHKHSPAVSRLVSRGVLRRTGKPKQAPVVPEKVEQASVEVRSRFAESLVERGKTTSPAVPPKHSAAEEEVVKATKAKKAKKASKAAEPAKAVEEDKKPTKRSKKRSASKTEAKTN